VCSKSGIVGDLFEHLCQLRVEPAARTGSHSVLRHVDAVRNLKHIRNLRQQRDPRIDRDRVSSQTERLATAVPMLVQILDTLRHRLRETHFSRDLRATMATSIHEFPSNLAAREKYLNQCPESLGEAGFQPGVRQHKAQSLRQTPIYCLGVVFEGQVIRHKELADAGRVAATSEILQQQRVVELPHLGVAEPNPFGYVHADPAATNAMPLGLPFDEIQSVAESPQEVRQPYLRRGCAFVYRGHVGGPPKGRRAKTMRGS
jgi:hypothetical protein